MAIYSGKRGFTLVELLVVIAIISLVSSIVLTSITQARAAARDARRISDARALYTAVYAYMTQNGVVPYGPGPSHLASVVPCSYNPPAVDWSSGLAPLVTGGFISALPRDPQGGCYVYSSFTNSAMQCGGEDINNYFYIISFETERPQPAFLSWNANPNKNNYCIRGPHR